MRITSKELAISMMLIGTLPMFAGVWVVPSFESQPTNKVNLCTIQDVNGDSLEIQVNSEKCGSKF